MNRPYDIMTAEEVAKLLGVNPQSIRIQAREDPHALGFPVIVMGKSVLIPRLPFYQFMGWEDRFDYEKSTMLSV